MAVQTSHPTQPRQADATGARGDIADDLEATVVDLIDLTLVAKQLHWNVAGPTFRPIHLQLDEVADAAREGTDRVAERLATLGGAPDGRSQTVAAGAGADVPAGPIRTDEAVRLAVGALDGITRRLRERIARLGEADPISQGILIDVAEELEKQAWMLRSHQANG